MPTSRRNSRRERVMECSSLLIGRRYRRRGHYIDRQPANAELIGLKRALQLGQRLWPEGPDRLLDHIVKQLLDESRVRFLAVGQEVRQVANATEFDHVAGSRAIAAGRIDRF